MKPENKDMLNKIKNKGAGFKAPERYFKEFGNNFSENLNKTKHGFKSPENYFENLEDKILVKINKSDLAKNTGFETPDNYFDNFDNEILTKINSNKSSKVISLNNYNYIKIISFSIAASFLLFIGINKFKSNTNSFNFETVAITEIENWVENDLISFNTYDITETFSDIDLVIDENYSDEEILDYLDNTDIENLIFEN